MNTESSALEWFGLAKSGVSWILIIIGWLIINSQHNNRERRKEVRKKVDDLISFIDDIEHLGITYHKNDRWDNELGQRVKSKLVRLSARLRILENLGCNVANAHLIRYRKSITLKNFETANHTKQAPHSELLKEIVASKQDLEQALEEAFYKRFH